MTIQLVLDKFSVAVAVVNASPVELATDAYLYMRGNIWHSRPSKSNAILTSACFCFNQQKDMHAC